jgi:hypothetical protein
MSMTHSILTSSSIAKPRRLDGNFKILLLICVVIALPSAALVLLLDGWVRILFGVVILANIGVLGLAYYGSLDPARAAATPDYPTEEH